MDINKINSTKNKELLWSILYDNGYFNNIANKNIEKIQQVFEDSILIAVNNISNTNNNTSNVNNANNIIEINKLILRDVINKIKSFKEDKKMIEIDILKKDLDSFMHVKKPEAIDFSDKEKNDEVLNSESLNTLLENLKINRNNDITNTIIENSNNKIDISNNKIDISNNKIISDLSNNKIENLKIINDFTNTIIENSNINEKIENLNINEKIENSNINDKISISNLNYNLNKEYNPEKIINLSVKIDYILNKINELEKNINFLLNKNK